MNRPVIFLDFYGVLTGKRSHRFDAYCCGLINSLCQELDAKIVIISDAVQRGREPKEWYDRVESVLGELTTAGIDIHHFMGMTDQPVDSMALWDRPNQIKTVIEEQSIDNYVIFDDLPLPFSQQEIDRSKNRIQTWSSSEEEKQKWIDRLPRANPEANKRFIRVDSSEGLTAKNIAQAKLILTGKYHVDRP